MTARIQTSLNDVVRDLLGLIEEGPYARNRCVYCAGRCDGRTCRAHRDLPQLERDLFTQANDDPTALLREEPAPAGSVSHGG